MEQVECRCCPRDDLLHTHLAPLLAPSRLSSHLEPSRLSSHLASSRLSSHVAPSRLNSHLAPSRLSEFPRRTIPPEFPGPCMTRTAHSHRQGADGSSRRAHRVAVRGRGQSRGTLAACSTGLAQASSSSGCMGGHRLHESSRRRVGRGNRSHAGRGRSRAMPRGSEWSGIWPASSHATAGYGCFLFAFFF